MAENIEILSDAIPEKTSPKITFTIEDEDGSGIAAASLDTLTLTLYNLSDSDKTIINSRDAQNILNANNVTVDSAGAAVWSVQSLDTAMIGSNEREWHRAVFAWTYNSSAKTGRHIIDMEIINLVKVT